MQNIKRQFTKIEKESRIRLVFMLLHNKSNNTTMLGLFEDTFLMVIEIPLGFAKVNNIFLGSTLTSLLNNNTLSHAFNYKNLYQRDVN